MKNILLSIVLICSILFGGFQNTFAVTPGWAPPEDYRDNSTEDLNEENSNISEGLDEPQSNRNIDDILGGELIFPFEPGLGN